MTLSRTAPIVIYDVDSSLQARLEGVLYMSLVIDNSPETGSARYVMCWKSLSCCKLEQKQAREGLQNCE